jgi:arginyl-tRNA--protein-N-Asp/Glu arginylyltransferase
MEQELVWVNKEQATKLKECQSEEEKYKVFEEYLTKVTEESKKEFKANFDNLEEDVAIYTGLMLKVKQTFEKAKHEQLEMSYAVWGKFEEEIPDIKDKVNKIISVLNPLEERLDSINNKLNKINTWDIERVIKIIENFQSLTTENKEMVDFLIHNFNKEK